MAFDATTKAGALAYAKQSGGVPFSPQYLQDIGYETGYTGGGGGGTTTYSSPAQAVAGPTAQQIADYTSQRDNTYGSINDRIGSEGTKYNSSILDFLDSTQGAQRKIDSSAVQNELSKRQGTSGVLDMIGHGLRSGGVTLANKNATTSSASDALARAYSDIGRRQITGVNNQYEKGNSAISDSQNELGISTRTGLRHLDESKTDTINTIVSDAQTALATLNQSAATATLPDRIDIEAKKQEIRSQAIAALQAFDAKLTNGITSIKPADVGTNRAKAAALDTAGTTADNPFNYTSAIPQQFQNTGPFSSELPIFTYKKNADATVGV